LGLLKKLQSEDLFSNLRLVGGTSLALQIGHRISVDIDLFGDLKCDNITLNNTLKSLAQYRIIQQTENIHIYNIENIKVDVVNYPYPWLQAPVTKDGLTLAAIEDIAAMKLAAITGRGSKKDFIDLYFLLQRFSLKEMLNLYLKKYNEGSVFMVLRSLAYFDDAEEELMPKMFVDIKWEKVKETIIDKLKSFQSSQ
jgi:predicted nucleotidyltransferase component of viral defense system